MDFSTGYMKGFLRPTLSHWLLKSDVKVYGSGRAAIIDVVRWYTGRGYSNLWMPAWQCSELVVALNLATNIKIKFYEIGGDDLVPTQTALAAMNPETDILLIIDYFAMVQESAFNRTIEHFSGPVIFDAVHSWLQSNIGLILPQQITVVSGFRKLFWKIAGAIVSGGISGKLSCIPTLIPHASPGFPRNASLSPRFGFLSKILLSVINLKMLDSISESWPRIDRAGFVAALRSPVKLVLQAEMLLHSEDEWRWPDLYSDLPLDVRPHAEELKARFLIVKRQTVIMKPHPK